jgi:hypothetical protein
MVTNIFAAQFKICFKLGTAHLTFTHAIGNLSRLAPFLILQPFIPEVLIPSTKNFEPNK